MIYLQAQIPQKPAASKQEVKKESIPAQQPTKKQNTESKQEVKKESLPAQQPTKKQKSAPAHTPSSASNKAASSTKAVGKVTNKQTSWA